MSKGTWDTLQILVSQKQISYEKNPAGYLPSSMISSPVNEQRNFRHIADNGFTKAEILRGEGFVIFALEYDLLGFQWNSSEIGTWGEGHVEEEVTSPKLPCLAKETETTYKDDFTPINTHYLAKLGGPDWSKLDSINSSITKQQESRFPISTMSTANSPRELSNRTAFSPSHEEVGDTAGSP